MKLVCVRTLDGLRPADERDRELISKLKLGKLVTVEVRQSRNIRELRLYFAILHLIFPQQSTWETVDDLDDAIRCAVGHCTKTTLKNGEIMVRPKRLSFNKLSQMDWRDYLDRVMRLVTTKIIPGLDMGDLRRELEAMTGISGSDR